MSLRPLRGRPDRADWIVAPATPPLSRLLDGTPSALAHDASAPDQHSLRRDGTDIDLIDFAGQIQDDRVHAARRVREAGCQLTLGQGVHNRPGGSRLELFRQQNPLARASRA